MLAVDLDSCCGVNDQVDPFTCGGDRDLTDDVMARSPEASSGEAFGEALAGRIRPVADGTERDGKTQEHTVEVALIDQVGVERPIETSDGDLELLVEDHPDQSLDERDGRGRAALPEFARLPVQYDPTRICG